MKRLLTITLALWGMTVMKAADGPQTVFIYSPGQGDGLHIAVLEGESWKESGRLCSSDYGTWGAEKKMFHPSVCRANDGTWRLVFQVNDHSPQFAAAYSRDLVNWRPQDYPIMSTKQCLDPVVFENPDIGHAQLPRLHPRSGQPNQRRCLDSRHGHRQRQALRGQQLQDFPDGMGENRAALPAIRRRLAPL